MKFVNSSWLVTTAALFLATTACSAEGWDDSDGPVDSVEQDLKTRSVATLLDAQGQVGGRVTFLPARGGTLVTASVSGQTPGFHGFHLHANADGLGCIAPAFTSVGGHYNGGTHGDHAGDLPSLLVNDNGQATMSVVTDRFSTTDTVGRAVIVHAGRDNFGNIPLGPNPDQYTANSDAAIALTEATGNAGARVLCGVIE
jgi:Cu-Zn family superoxide dismutase